MALMKKTLEEYMREYAAAHTQPGTKVTHMFGIPMILASLPLAPVLPPASAGLFVGGWVSPFIGETMFGRSGPRVFGGPFNLSVALLWVAAAWARYPVYARPGP